VSVAVLALQQDTPLPDAVSRAILYKGIHLPPPKNPPRVFSSTTPSPLMDEVIADLLRHDILRCNLNIKFAFRMFLVAKSNGAARPVVDMSLWTPYYQTPPVRLYSAAEVLVTIDPVSINGQDRLKIRIFSDTS
jgi:hypothetical protein